MPLHHKINWMALGTLAVLIPALWALNQRAVAIVQAPDELRDFKTEVRTNLVDIKEELRDIRGELKDKTKTP